MSLVRQLQVPTAVDARHSRVARAGLGHYRRSSGLLASYFVNINRFSLHALYRNRLIRGYLGASRQERDPDRFTGFDIKDNIRVHELWPPKSTAVRRRTQPVSRHQYRAQCRVDQAFGVAGTQSGIVYRHATALRQRLSGLPPERANTASVQGQRRHLAGHRDGDFRARRSSPNMGYHSSPSITLLLALFNVRLGWWLGNPGEAGEESYQSDGPRWSAKPLFYEAFGQTTDQSRYVYLSDGGHFENLGSLRDGAAALPVHRRHRRRLRPEIRLRGSRQCGAKNLYRSRHPDPIRGPRGAAQSSRHRGRRPPHKIPYFAIGTIDYKEADGVRAESDNGYILYIKPAYHGTEGAGDQELCDGQPKDFPHEATADQWFTESQFESYRSLGLEHRQQTFSAATSYQRVSRGSPSATPLRALKRASRGLTPSPISPRGSGVDDVAPARRRHFCTRRQPPCRRAAVQRARKLRYKDLLAGRARCGARRRAEGV